jgi:hypothetical protein
MSMAATIVPALSVNSMDPVPFFFPLWLKECTDALSVMYLSGDKIVPVEFGVWSIVQYITVLSFDIVLHWPIPMASHELPLLSSLLYVMTGMGVARS